MEYQEYKGGIMEDTKSLRDEVLELKDLIKNKVEGKNSSKKFRLPWKARVNRLKLKKGYITIGVIEDNMNLDFRKEPIIDGTIKLDNTYHAVEEFDIFNYKNKPFIFQCKSKINPYNPLKGEHETYGQKYVMARMEGERIISKKQMGWGISIGILIIVGVIIYALATGG